MDLLIEHDGMRYRQAVTGEADFMLQVDGRTHLRFALSPCGTMKPAAGRK